MKKRIFVTLVLINLCLTACTAHEHSFSEADCIHPATCTECGETAGEALGHTSSVGVCSRCGMVGNEELLATLNVDFEHMMEAGNTLFSCLAGITDLDADKQYSKFLKADQCTETMLNIYEEIITACVNSGELNAVANQTNLLKNTCPPPISGSDTTSLANQGVLYQLYLQQLSSSCSYISEYLNYFAGNGEPPAEVTYFAEIPELPTPDTIIYGISYNSTQNAPGNIQYMYLLGNSETDAMLNYNLFLIAIEENTSLKVDISDSMAMVYQNGNIVSVMMAGNDSSIGYFLAVSFQA